MRKSMLKASDLTQTRLRELLLYDPETGFFTSKSTIGRRTKGFVYTRTGSRGYVVIDVDGQRYAAHRLAWLYMHGTDPENYIDHIDGNRSNNRLANLRDVTHSVNMQNQRRAKSHNKPGLLGVGNNGSGFRARITVDGKVRNLGTYQTPELAHKAYLSAKREAHKGCAI